MKKTDIKHVIGNLAPPKEMEFRLREKIMQKHSNKLIFKPIVSIAASLIIIISFGILKSNFIDKNPNTAPPVINSSEGIYVPKIDLPKNTNAAMDMIGFIKVEYIHKPAQK